MTEKSLTIIDENIIRIVLIVLVLVLRSLSCQATKQNHDQTPGGNRKVGDSI